MLQLTLVVLLGLSLSTVESYSRPSKKKRQKNKDRRPLNWGLGDTLSTFGISAEKAWKYSQGTKKTIVAIIDTGVDYTHPDILPNLWRNKGEMGLDKKGRPKNTNGIDDDKNGYIDDEIGFDFVDSDGKPYDSHSHGTHIAGIIGGRGSRQIKGVSPHVSLMILRYYNPNASGEVNLQNTIKAINYAVDNGAHIINYSAGGPSFSKEEYKAIKRAEKKGILFVSAAGNERQNADKEKYFPASYKLKNIISVTAIDAKGKLLTSSNYGRNTVDIAAPGKSIISSIPNGGMGPMTGTSQATAFVTGLAALIHSIAPKLSYKKVKSLILKTGFKMKGLRNRTVSGRIVNAEKALKELEKTVSPKMKINNKNITILPKPKKSKDT